LLLEEEVPLISTVHPILGNKLLGNKEDEHSQIHLNIAAAKVEAKRLKIKSQKQRRMNWEIQRRTKSRTDHH